MDELLLLGPRGLVLTAAVPRTRGERMGGLLGRSGIEPGEALLLRARSVHTFGMRFPILVALLDNDLRVRRVLRSPPGRLVRPRPRVRHVLECAVGTDIRAGDVLRAAGAAAILLRLPPAARAPIV